MINKIKQENYGKEPQVFSLALAKKKWINQKLAKDLTHYYSFLALNELINESTDTANMINQRPLDNELALRSKILLNEFKKRIEPHVGQMHEGISSMIKEVNIS